jgi:hypothetical protein
MVVAEAGRLCLTHWTVQLTFVGTCTLLQGSVQHSSGGASGADLVPAASCLHCRTPLVSAADAGFRHAAKLSLHAIVEGKCRRAQADMIAITACALLKCWCCADMVGCLAASETVTKGMLDSG